MITSQLNQIREAKNNAFKKVNVPAQGSNLSIQVMFKNDYMNQYVVSVDGIDYFFSKGMYAKDLYNEVSILVENAADDILAI